MNKFDTIYANIISEAGSEQEYNNQQQNGYASAQTQASPQNVANTSSVNDQASTQNISKDGNVIKYLKMQHFNIGVLRYKVNHGIQDFDNAAMGANGSETSGQNGSSNENMLNSAMAGLTTFLNKSPEEQSKIAQATDYSQFDAITDKDPHSSYDN